MSPESAHVIRPPVGGPGITRFATRGDHRLSYESSGAAEGFPVLALHDLLADRGQCRMLSETLIAAGFRVALPDARGHGASPTISGRAYPTRELVADTLAVLDAEGLTTGHVVAVGWGAGIALGLAATAPERVASLVLVAPYLPQALAEPDRQQETLQEAAAAVEKGQIDRALDLFFGLRLGEDWRDRLPKPRLAAIRRSAGNLAPLLTGMTAEPFGRQALGRIEVPTIILLKADASAVESGTANELRSILPNSRRATVVPKDDEPYSLGAPWIPAIVSALGA